MDHRRTGLGVALLFAAGLAQAATQGPPAYVYTGTMPSGVCTGTRVWIAADGSGTHYCNAGTWAEVTAAMADPAACGAGAYVSDVSATGALTCSTPPGTYALPDAAAGTTGGVRLTGDLGGTAVSPTVPGLSGKAATAHSHTTTEVSGLDATNDFTAGVLPGARGGVGVALPTCGGTDKLSANGTQVSCAADQTGGGGSGTMTRLTGTWASSASANTLGIVGAGGVPMTSPTYAGAAPFSFTCRIATTRPATTNGPRYGIQSSGTVTRISYRAEVGLAAATQTITKGLALATASCAAGCTTALTTGTLAQVVEDEIAGTGVMNATGTLSLVMAPSAAAANTAQIGSYCIWY